MVFIKQKKAKMFLVIVLAFIFVFPVLFILNFALSTKKNNFEKEIGETQLILLRTYEKGESPLFYIDEAARQILNQRITMLLDNGWGAGSSCGSVLGYRIWHSSTSDCYPSQSSAENAIAANFQRELYNYFDTYPEPLPHIQYDLSLETENRLELIGRAQEELRIDVSDDFVFDFEPSEAGEVQPSPTPGDCQHIAEFAKRYAGCRYSETPYIVDPENCPSYGLTCAMLVHNSMYFTTTQRTWGDGKFICNDDSFVYRFSTLSELQPGDAAAAISRHPLGHALLYVGRGYVTPDTLVYWVCHSSYNPAPDDSNADYIFIHSTGTAGVAYSSHTELFREFNPSASLSLVSFCRHRDCVPAEG
ncbi:hypothetical protein JW930_00095 [Candidatus Woesearchaeota archaeon]|nr:hypothetical protein [Candidatus Woesearchaeota archaeon]